MQCNQTAPSCVLSRNEPPIRAVEVNQPERGSWSPAKGVVMDELASDTETASVKPLLMVAGMLVAAGLGAVATVHPAAHIHQPHKPSAGVVVVESPRAPLHRLHDLRPPLSRTEQDAYWV